LNSENTYHFKLLKQEITRTYLLENSASTSINDWKGEDIVAFQEDLFKKVKASVSEKWFYTYIKNKPEKLPRIDILNLLSSYVGFQNWTAFKDTHPYTEIAKEKTKAQKKYYALLLLLPMIASVFYFMNLKNEFQFCFIDEDKNEVIDTVLDIKILQNFESPLYLKTDSLGCFSYATKEKKIKFIVQSPYYKTDTILRTIGSQINNTIKLHTDDYALMLHYYSNGNVKDLKKRKLQLQHMIAEKAQIYQVFSQNIGIEIYSKKDFISKLTIPTNSLKNIKIIDKTYQNGKIVKLKFMIQ